MPSESFHRGLTSANLGEPVLDLAKEQHGAYCSALVRSGLQLILLDPDDIHPDSVFVEDTAILTERCAVITRPGAASRRGEIDEIATEVAKHYSRLDLIEHPGTVDGGDVCRIEDHFLIGLSERTNETGARQLHSFLAAAGYTASFVDIRRLDGVLHLKSGLSYLGDKRIMMTKDLVTVTLPDCERVLLPEGEEYAANCVRANEFVIIAAGHPKTAFLLKSLGYQLIELDVSEFRKMDGGLSCLSLRF